MPNALQFETSPYLLQHAHNPVDWQPWKPETLARAQAENKLLLVSIGYSACHWCHVMERESFEDKEVAELMNRHFINIKVDREERPDGDRIYMDAVMMMTGRGGWPLNAIALPDGRPIYGGTYFPKENWKQLLAQMAALYAREPDRALTYADQLVGEMQRLDQVKPGVPQAWSSDEILALRDVWLAELDFKWGGRKVRANKFPLPANNLFLLRAGWLLQDPEMQAAARTTLEKMAFGGIYDHLGGGFSRYSVDAYWKVPHFEKMLYDNGQLLSLYAEAWRQSPDPHWQRVAYQTAAWLEREMLSPEGGFYAALDADSEGEEGKFYTWAFEELESLLGADARLFADYYNAHPFGNWEERNVLFVLETEEVFAQRWQLDPAAFSAQMAAGRQRLFEARQQRPRPGLDDKILASWNGLALRGLADAALAFGEESFLRLAVRNARFLTREMMEADGLLWRNYKQGRKSIEGFLDDYAMTVDGLLGLYEASLDETWIWEAKKLAEYALAHFSDEHSGLFYYTSDRQEALIRRKMETQDDVIPSSNAVMARNLHSLGLLLGETAWLERAERMMAAMRQTLIQNPSWHAAWAQLALRLAFPHFEVAVSGPGAAQALGELRQRYYPNALYCGSEGGSRLPILEGRQSPATRFYVCQGRSCQLPVQTAAEAWRQMGGRD